MTVLVGFLLAAQVTAADLVWYQDLEDDDGGFVSYGDTEQWEWGTISSGPGASYDGAACWATQVAGWYLNDTDDYLQLPTLPIDGLTRPVLRFQQWYAFQDGDWGLVEVYTGDSWERTEPLYDYSGSEGFRGTAESWEPTWFDLSSLAQGDEVRLAIHANGAGADVGWYVDAFYLYDGDPVPPYVVVESCLPDTEDLTGTYPVQAQVRDDVGLDSVLLLYSIDGGDELHLDMTDMGESVYQADIPAQEAGTTVSYTVWASDGDNTTTVPIPACSFEVRLPAPTDLSGPEGVVWGSVAQLDWQAPDSTHEVVGYRIYRDDRLQLEVEQPPVEVSVITGSQSFEVSALYVSGEGARSEAFEIEAAVPAIHGLDPEAAYQGDLIRLALEGEYLLLEQGDMAIELGPDIRVDEYDVRDVDAAFVTVQVGGHADSGVRDLLLTTGGEEVSLAGAFEVLPGSDRPTLLGVEPTSLRQGDEGALTITASEPFAGEPTVWLGGDILVEATEWSQGEIVMVDVLVPYDTPLGLHSLEVDDGTRIYTGLNLQVRDYLEPVNPDGCCSANPRGARGWLSLLLVPLVVLRRRSRGN